MWLITDLLSDILKVLLDIRKILYENKNRTTPTDSFKSSEGRYYKN